MSHARTVPFAEFGCFVKVDHGAVAPLIAQEHHVFPVELQKLVWPEVTRAHPKVTTVVPLCGTHHDSVHELIRRKRHDPLAFIPAQPAEVLGLAERALRMLAKARKEKRS